jgi:hypothetical protein
MNVRDDSGLDGTGSSMSEKPGPTRRQLILPGLILLANAAGSGPTVFWLTGICFLLCLAMCLRLLYLGVRLRRVSTRMLGPILTIVASAGTILHCELSLEGTRVFALQVAKQVQTTCNERHRCPLSIPGWDPGRGIISARTTYSSRGLSWPVNFRSDGKTYSVRIHKGPDFDEAWSGHVDASDEPKFSHEL